MFAISFILILAPMYTSSMYSYEAKELQRYISYYPNPYFSTYLSGDDIVLTVHQTINRHDNFRINVQLMNNKSEVVLKTNRGINLCDELEMELLNIHLDSNGNVFGLTGLRCPIQPGNVRDMIDVIPFSWPQTHSFDMKIDYGIYKYEIILSKCDSNDITCKPIIIGGIQSSFTILKNHTSMWIEMSKTELKMKKSSFKIEETEIDLKNVKGKLKISNDVNPSVKDHKIPIIIQQKEHKITTQMKKGEHLDKEVNSFHNKKKI